MAVASWCCILTALFTMIVMCLLSVGKSSTHSRSVLTTAERAGPLSESMIRIQGLRKKTLDVSKVVSLQDSNISLFLFFLVFFFSLKLLVKMITNVTSAPLYHYTAILLDVNLLIRQRDHVCRRVCVNSVSLILLPYTLIWKHLENHLKKTLKPKIFVEFEKFFLAVTFSHHQFLLPYLVLHTSRAN